MGCAVAIRAGGQGIDGQPRWTCLGSCCMLGARAEGHDSDYGTPAGGFGGTGKVAAFANAAVAAAAVAVAGSSQLSSAAASAYACFK